MRRFAPISLADATLLAIFLTSALAPCLASAQDAAGTATMPAAVTVTTTTTTSDASATPKAAPKAAPSEAEASQKAAKQRARDMRTGSTELGAAGGIYVVDPAAPATQSLRMQALASFFVKKDYLYNGDKERFGQSALSLAYVPYHHIEVTAATTTRVAKNDRADPAVLQSIGNMHFGVKAGGEVSPGVALGGDVLASFLNGPGDAGINFKGTSAGLRGSLGLDLRKMTRKEVPLIFRANFAYIFDNSAKMVRDTEAARFRNLQARGVTSATEQRDDYRQLVRRDERLGLGISRVDVARLALGAEVPIEINEHVAIHPLLEWQLDIPVNRQGYDCTYVKGASGGKLAGTDSCLADEGVDVWHQHVTIGARLYPYAGLNVLAAVDLGVGGATNFVQELAPNAPYRILLGAGYNADLIPRPPIVREVQKLVEVPVAAGQTLGRLRGVVREQGNEGVVVADARIAFPGRTLNALTTRADGSFETYALEPGDVQLAVEAEGYEPGNCAGAIPVTGGDVTVNCVLHALPRVATVNVTVTDENGAAVPGAAILLTGPDTRSVVTDATGHAHAENLAPGSYHARVDQAGYLLANSGFDLLARKETATAIVLVHTPKSAAVVISKDKIRLKGKVLFATGTAQIESASTALLTELADTMQRHPELLRVEVQGHTDDRGDPATNLSLSQSRADAVKTWLVQHGVEGDRLATKGMGAERPLAPNLNEGARAKNRRVELVILSRAGQ